MRRKTCRNERAETAWGGFEVREAMQHPLDNPIWSALSGPHQAHAIGRGLALHYRRDVTPFSAILEPTVQAYADLAVHLPPGALARMFRPSVEPLPKGWVHVEDFPLLQMVSDRAPLVDKAQEADLRLLSSSDLPHMLSLVELTKPGPFEVRAMELGAYWGVWERGHLAAMAGERLQVPGYVEISAICTNPNMRCRGLATLLVHRLVSDILERGDLPFLHVAEENRGAIALYEKLGFRVRKHLHVLRRRLHFGLKSQPFRAGNESA
jgi:ribosomal protein S18 acetylase RimI-like enzyme